MQEFQIGKAFFAILCMAVLTYLIRMLPITLFRSELKSKFMKSFLYYVPYAVLGALTFPGVFSSTGNVYTSIGGTVVALVLAYMEKSLVLVAIGGICAVFLMGIWIG